MTELDELFAAWHALALHAEACDRCDLPVAKLRDGERLTVTWGMLCRQGKGLADIWLTKTEDWLATRRPQRILRLETQ